MRLRWWIAAYLLVLAVVLSAPLASNAPDGLERLAESEGFAESATDPQFSILAEYLFPGVENEIVALLLAGWVGVTAIFLLAGGLALTVKKRRALRD